MSTFEEDLKARGLYQQQGNADEQISFSDAQASAEPPPHGYYIARVEAAELKSNKTAGKRLQVRLSVVGGDYHGRPMFTNFNVIHPNKEAVRIGKQQFADFALACGVAEPAWAKSEDKATRDKIAKLVAAGKVRILDGPISITLTELKGLTVGMRTTANGKYTDCKFARPDEQSALGETPATPATQPVLS